MCIGILGQVSGEIVSELIFFRHYLESATQRPPYTSCLWRLRGKRWWRWIRWRRSTLAMLALSLWVLVFVWFFHFFVFDSTYPSFSFFKLNFPLVFVGPLREELLIPFSEWTCFLCPSSVILVALLSAIDEWNINEYRYDKIIYISSL